MNEAEASRALVLRAASLARSAPREWNEFVTAFRNLTEHRRDECISSPADNVFVAQGRAREAASLLRLMEHCLKTADQIQEKRK